jgi:hypothetical protein
VVPEEDEMTEENKNLLCEECYWLGEEHEADKHLFTHANIATVVVFCPVCGVRIKSTTSQPGYTPKSKRL